MTDRNGDDDGLDDEFERLGRLAGAELRTPPPADGPLLAQGAARRRRVTTAAVAAGATAFVVVIGLLAVDAGTAPDGPPAPPATAPSTTTAPPGTGAWRTVPDAPDSTRTAVAATWTGTEAIVLGFAEADPLALEATAYEPTTDGWRVLATPPPGLAAGVAGPGRSPRWTGSEVLAVGSDGQVFSYDPVEDHWTTRTPPAASVALSSSSTIAVSAGGVLARSSTGWWWYEGTADRWTPLPEPMSDGPPDLMAPLGDGTMVASWIDGSAVVSSVLDLEARTWADGPSVEGPDSPREDMSCTASANLVVCAAEGYGNLAGTVIDPLVGPLGTFSLGNHTSGLAVEGIPWYTHAWKILLPGPDPTWEDLPALAGVGAFNAAVWTGDEILFFGGSDPELGVPPVDPVAAAYTPARTPDG